MENNFPMVMPGAVQSEPESPEAEKHYKRHTKAYRKTAKIAYSPDEQVNEASEWEERHDEFVRAGEAATSEQVKNVISHLDNLSNKADKKRGFLNTLTGKTSNGDLARTSYAAGHLKKLLLQNINAAPGSEERKELGQHLVYAKSLLNRNKELLGVKESMVAYGMGQPEQSEETENVTYSKTKSKGDASVTISANAKSMQDLHDVLKLAGITLPADHPANQEPEAEPEADCGCEEPEDPSYTTDKQAIIDRLRDTLKAKLSL